MFEIEFESTFKKDYKKAKKNKRNLDLLEEVLLLLRKKGSLPSSYKPHKLKGNYKGFWECHIQPDWLLIWKLDSKNKIIYLSRTGKHSDLFT
ncbi:type II toxin-antitoxin system YafQ family toxin [Brumimicrobium glaciale]|uniref:Type II toxin-antitoxin system YafQ family toxin n=1 Tax=Brumimicrobium glaciale TaxID=200475 RepID=A0A4V1WFW0_9FLAO|nr:type II toxin-antitoxin system YafQ family toxin [Brumimicrobium glaciale]RYM34566.1 type II toxin-antitoxin system YafQ family toxin [Brumimicrobium glaciale]